MKLRGGGANKRRLFLVRLKTVEFLGVKWIKMEKKKKRQEKNPSSSNTCAELRNGDILGEQRYALTLFLPPKGRTLT